MSRLSAFLPHARIIVFLLGIVGPVLLMGLRGEWIYLQLCAVSAAAMAIGCSLERAPLAFRFIAIIAAMGALFLQVVDLFRRDSTWGLETAPVLWVLQAGLAGSLVYLIWWNQRRLRVF